MQHVSFEEHGQADEDVQLIPKKIGLF